MVRFARQIFSIAPASIRSGRSSNWQTGYVTRPIGLPSGERLRSKANKPSGCMPCGYSIFDPMPTASNLSTFHAIRCHTYQRTARREQVPTGQNPLAPLAGLASAAGARRVRLASAIYRPRQTRRAGFPLSPPQKTHSPLREAPRDALLAILANGLGVKKLNLGGIPPFLSRPVVGKGAKNQPVFVNLAGTCWRGVSPILAVPARSSVKGHGSMFSPDWGRDGHPL